MTREKKNRAIDGKAIQKYELLKNEKEEEENVKSTVLP